MKKKSHPHGLPHLTDARKPDGSVNLQEVLAGMEAWKAKLVSGEYTITHVTEFATNDSDDVLIMSRRRNR